MTDPLAKVIESVDLTPEFACNCDPETPLVSIFGWERDLLIEVARLAERIQKHHDAGCKYIARRDSNNYLIVERRWCDCGYFEAQERLQQIIAGGGDDER